MTAEEVFQTVRSQLMFFNGTQRSQGSVNGVLRCKYHGREGMKCPIGTYVPDHLYSRTIERISPNDDLIFNFFEFTPTHKQKVLLRALRRMHDYSSPCKWREDLIRIFDNFKLRW